MSYSTSFTTITGDVKKDYLAQACFSSIYANVNHFDSILVYVLKNYKDAPANNSNNRYAHDTNQMHFTEEEIICFHQILQAMGLVVDLEINDKVVFTFEREVLPYDCYSFKINCKKNGTLQVLFLLNAIRFLYEEDHYHIIRKVLEWKDEQDCSYYTTFCIAGFAKDGYLNSNHNFYPEYNNLLTAMSDEDFLKLPKNGNCRNSLPRTKGIMIYTEKAALVAAVKNKSFTEILTKYTELCEKYS